ncbi:hypothetical protein [Sneathiella sp. HT1-7]|uniref:hypothetical protein n=1 Tax=Sneathiella sp. HT1-7 TaxID=2887192 RepID=UPI001D14F551|nr:hypothetical protein [Sneathiella sp. HT1-7]MCC3305591.1 hypothetical protein [Sneathiella sp. HT1-7]
MENLLTVPKATLSAIAFVARNFKPFLFRSLSIILLASVLEILMGFLSTELGYAIAALMTFVYAIFMVSWHRYSVLSSENAQKGFVGAFGLRELKFGALFLAAGVVFVLSQNALSEAFQEGIATLIFFVIVLLCTNLLLFFYPAIALNQPINAGWFLYNSLRLFFSFLFAALMAVALFFVPAALTVGFGYLVLTYIPGDLSQAVLIVVFQKLITFLTLAVAASTASFLYRDVIGLQEEAGATTPQ